MERIKRWVIRILEGERGQDMVETALIIVVISIPIVIGAIVISPAFTAWAQQVADTMTGG